MIVKRLKKTACTNYLTSAMKKQILEMSLEEKICFMKYRLRDLPDSKTNYIENTTNYFIVEVILLDHISQKQTMSQKQFEYVKFHI